MNENHRHTVNSLSIGEYVNEPMLPPGIIINEEDNPVSTLVDSFHKWIGSKKYTIAEMSNVEIVNQLRALGGIGAGPVTPKSWSAGRRPANPLIVEMAYQKLLEMRDSQQHQYVAPLLPPDVKSNK